MDIETTARSSSQKLQSLPSSLHSSPRMLLLSIAMVSAIISGLFSASLHLAKAQSAPSTLLQDTEPLQIHKTADVNEAEIGQTVTYSIAIINNGSAVDGLRMEDALPVGLAYISGTAVSDIGEIDFNAEFNQIGWRGVLQTEQRAHIRFQARILPDRETNHCRHELTNQAMLIVDNTRQLLTEPVIIKIVCPDLGDAPDSTNHHAVGMTAYPATTAGTAITAQFPTVYDPTTGTPSGPRHRYPTADAWLGQQVSGEHDADLFPDMDGIPNLKPLNDSADHDHEDDGIARKPLLRHCEPTEMDVLITVVGPARERFVNVWFDWNRDGDWEDRFDCPGTTTSEWAIQNAVTTLGPGQHTVTLPVFLSHNPNPEAPLWTRVTLAEMRAPLMPDTDYANGSGPAEGYRYGETEDYYIRTNVPDPNELALKKRANVTTTVPGDFIEYTVSIHNTGNLTAANVTMIDPIPAGTVFVAGSATATLPTVNYDPTAMQIKWNGDIPSGGSVDVTFKVQVTDNVECSRAIVNHAAILGDNQSPIKSAEVTVRVNCPGEAALSIKKQSNVTTTVAGGMIEYTVTIQNSGNITADNVTMIDPIPLGTMFVSGTLGATAGSVLYDPANNKVKWQGDIGPNGTVTVKFKAKVLENALCEKPIVNRAALLLANGNEGPVAEAVIRLQCQGQAELRFKKEAEPSTVLPGGVVTYKLIVENAGSAPATALEVVDPIPAGTTFVAGSLNASLPTANFDAPNHKVVWNGAVPAGGNVLIRFQVQVDEQATCGSRIHNRAVLFAENSNLEKVAEADVNVTCDEPAATMDFGDAPDSLSNHHNRNNTAYPSTLGRFPTVWGNTPAGEGSGPAHAQINHVWLGKAVTAEKDADLLPDGDGTTNILNAGADDVADNDKADDGWLNASVPIENCRETMFHVRVSRANVAPQAERLYLNVWFDGNRDGDWEDVGECPGSDNLNRGRSFEWIVQNYKIDAALIPAGDYREFRVPTVLVHNLKPEAKAWMRFTLSEEPAVRPLTATSSSLGLPDGRGPAFPATFRIGETEDYLRPGDNVEGKPGEIGIDKTVELRNRTDAPITVGDVITYSVYLKHSGGTAAATTVMTDLLPAEVELAGRIKVYETAPSATPLFAEFNPGAGPNGTVSWRGRLSPDAGIKIVFPVRIKVCPRHDDNTTPAIRNVATALQTDGSTIRAVKEVAITCEPTATPDLKLIKAIVISRETDESAEDRSVVTESDDSGFLSGEKPIYLLRLESRDNLTHAVTISDSVPTGLVVTGVSSNFGQARVTGQGTTVLWKGEIGPANSPAEIKLEVRPTTRIVCGERMVNVAHWWTTDHRGASNPVTLFLVCRDLGDAPDSTNHAGVTMEAYSGVKANYPTVFDVATPERGPLHKHAQPFHLGEGVTSEFEADTSFDSDGVHNIEPTLDRPNLDRRDDGLRLESVNLRHCEFNTMKVAVSIDSSALSLLAAHEGTGYLNVWVDSNRDGDWADSFDCPRTDNNKIALEHIVIDLPINAALLGAGMHELLVDTTVPVAFPNEGDVAGMPAWLRVTLSEKPSNKPFTAGALTYGDGRGYDEPFRLGETEDYLLRASGQTGEADVSIKKRGHLQPEFDTTTHTRFWQINWVVNYANTGGATANNVSVTDTLGSGQTLQGVRSIPPISPTVSGGVVEAALGDLAAGRGGTLILKTVVPYNTAPGTVIRNEATISADNESVTINNTTVATVTVPLLPPLITSPVPGTTCTGTLEVTGHAQAGVEVDIYVNNTREATITADSNGDWATSLTLPDGTYDIYAIARQGTLTSEPTPPVNVIVDSSLFWNPMSLRFTDENGRVIRPSGRLDESGWSVFLRGEHTYTISLQICCEDPNVQVEVELNGTVIPLSDEEGDGTYSATFTSNGRQIGSIRICVICELIKRCSDGELTIDPEGTVFNLLTGLPVSAADVACFQATVGAANTEQSFALWPAADYQQINPQAVGADGYFSFFTPPGTYQLDVSRDGYQTYRSWNLVVVDAPVHFDVPLTPLLEQAADQAINVTNDGFEPAVVTVAPGAVIEWTNVGEGLHTTTSITPTVSFGDGTAAGAGDSGAWDSGLLTPGSSYKRQLTAEGTYTYRDSENPAFTATIIVAEPTVIEQPTGSMIFLPLVAR